MSGLPVGFGGRASDQSSMPITISCQWLKREAAELSGNVYKRGGEPCNHCIPSKDYASITLQRF
jgi:hypothetical protein